MLRSIHGLCGLLLIASAPALLAAGAADVPLDYLAQSRVGDRLPPQWKVRSVSGASVPRTSVVEWQGRRAIRFTADDAAAWYGAPLAQPLDPARGSLRWSWQVRAPLSEVALRVRTRDDSPARMIVVFGKASLVSRPRILFYTWGNGESVDDAWHSYVSDRFGIVVVRNAQDPTERWVTEQRDLLADYKRVFGGTPEPVTAIGFMIDTEQTQTAATAHLGPVSWVPRP